MTQVAGCCGLAGNFGMEKGHYEVSVAVAETHLLPAVRAEPRARSCSPTGCPAGCSSTTSHGTPTMHLAELLASRLERVNPRHRRLVIPIALVALLLIVVIAAVLLASERAAAPRAEPDARLHPRPRRAGQGGRRPAGRRASSRRWRRVELRYVDLKAGRHLQITTYDDTQAFTANHAVGDAARDAVDALLDEPFGNWHVDTTTQSTRCRVTKKLEAVVHTTDRDDEVEVDARARPRQAAAAGRGRPGLHRARHLRRERASSSRAGRRSTARSRSSCGCSTPRSPRPVDKGHLRQPDRPRTRCGSSTSAAATPT